MSATLPEVGFSPIYFGQNVYHATSIESRCLAGPGGHARLFGVNVNTALAGCKVCIFDGVSAMSGKLLACIDASTKQSYVFGGVRCPAGIYVQITGNGSPDITFNLEAALDGGDLTFSGGLITDPTRVANTQGDGITEPFVLTLSGNEITDASRSALVQGDGRAVPDSSYGIWGATTNLCTNGGGETNATTWGEVNGGGGTVARVTTDFKFGTACLANTFGATTNSWMGIGTSTVVAPSTTHTMSVWAKGPAGFQVAPFMRERDAADAFIVDDVGPTVTLTGDWQRITLTVALGGTTARLRYGLKNVTGTAQIVNMDGMQLEAKLYATPYVETNGGTAARVAARVQVPTTLVRPSAGWWAVKIRMGYSDTQAAGLGFSPRIASWVTDSNNRMLLVYDRTNKKFVIESQIGGGAFAFASTSALTFSAGDTFVVLAQWDGSNLKISSNGGAFATASSVGSWPVLSSSTFDIGSEGGNTQFDGDFLWCAAGNGVLTDADAARINSAEPAYISDLPAQPSFFWDCSSPVITPIADSSTGIWEQTTNFFPNGGAETNATANTSAIGGAAVSRDTTTFKFGTASFKTITTAVANDGISHNTATGLAAAPGVIFAGSVWMKGNVGGESLDVWTRITNTDATVTEVAHTAVVLTTSWQRITPTTVTVAVGKTGDQVTVFARQLGASVQTFFTDGAQAEQKVVATPYVETNLATAGRVIGRIQAPTTLLAPTQGWFAARMRLGWGHTTLPHGGAAAGETVMLYTDISLTAGLKLFRREGSDFWIMRAISVGDATTPATHAAGDIVTVVGRWEPTRLGVSLNGAAFSNAAFAPAASIPGVLFDIGSDHGAANSCLDGDFLWCAAGTGTLTDTDAATFSAWGNTDPRVADFPTAAGVTMIWHGSGTQYITP